MRNTDSLPLIWSAMATQDLLDLSEHVAADASPAIADRQLREIDRVCGRLRAWPEYGRIRNDICEGLRSVVAVRYVIFYRVEKSPIEIARILDERRDVDRVFAELV